MIAENAEEIAGRTAETTVGAVEAAQPGQTTASGDKPEWWSSDEWATPDDVFARIAAEFGPFDLDPCCRPQNAKAPEFYTKSDDGLSRPWFGRVWVNPPYSNPREWIKRAIFATAHEGARVVMLLPGAIDTTWFHGLVLPHADIVFIKGRVKFIGWKGTPIGSPKSGNVLAIFPKRTNVFVLSERNK